jgi:hypothetical protein
MTSIRQRLERRTLLELVALCRKLGAIIPHAAAPCSFVSKDDAVRAVLRMIERIASEG